MYEYQKQILKQQNSLLMYILMGLISIFAVFEWANGLNYSSAITIIFINPYYFVTIGLIILINTINIYKDLDKNFEYIIRCCTKEDYLNFLIKIILDNNILLLGFNLLLTLSLLNIFNLTGVNYTMLFYEVSAIAYSVFTIIKFISINILILLLNIVLLKIFNNKIIIILNFILYASTLTLVFDSNNIINSIKDLPLFLGFYMNLIYYSNFFIEITCFTTYLAILIFIYSILKFLVIKYTIEVGN